MWMIWNMIWIWSSLDLNCQPPTSTLPEPVETTAPKKWQAERVRSAEAQAWQQAEVALEAAKVRRVVTKGRDGWGMTWWSDWNILKHHQNKVLLCFFFLETRSSFTLGRFCIERFEIAGLRMFGRQWIWFKTWSRDHWGRLRRTSYRRRWMLDLMKVRWHHVVSADPTPWNVKGIIVPWSQIWGWSVKIGS